MGKQVVKFPKKPKFNLMLLILLLIYVYIIASFLTFYSSEHINSYEVKEGALMQNNRFEAIVLKEDELVTSAETGYVNYFINEGSRGAYGDLIYTLDESGSVLEYTERIVTEDGILTLDELESLEYDLDEFKHGFEPKNFSNVSAMQNTVSNKVSNMVNIHLLSDIESSKSLKNNLTYHYVQDTGIVSYWSDGYEDLKAEDVTSAVFDQELYKRKDIANNDLIGSNEVVYKYCNDERWSIAFVSQDEALSAYLIDEGVVHVTFLKNGFDMWGTVGSYVNDSQETVIEISFTAGSIHFASDRFVNVELELEDNMGLKIPVSSIAQKEFFLIPEEYVIQDESDGCFYVYLESYLESGEKTILKEKVDPYYFMDAQYYIEDEMVNVGTRLSMPDNTTQYVVSTKGSLIGVYNINKGYADFKQITILEQNDDYAIVQSNTKYGLSVYDFIALDAEIVDDDTFINK